MRIGAVITIVAAHAVAGRACARKNTVRVSTTQLRITMHALE
jgi:hypothetical protein